MTAWLTATGGVVAALWLALLAHGYWKLRRTIRDLERARTLREAAKRAPRGEP